MVPGLGLVALIQKRTGEWHRLFYRVVQSQAHFAFQQHYFGTVLISYIQTAIKIKCIACNHNMQDNYHSQESQNAFNNSTMELAHADISWLDCNCIQTVSFFERHKKRCLPSDNHFLSQPHYDILVMWDHTPVLTTLLALTLTGPWPHLLLNFSTFTTHQTPQPLSATPQPNSWSRNSSLYPAFSISLILQPQYNLLSINLL